MPLSSQRSVKSHEIIMSSRQLYFTLLFYVQDLLMQRTLIHYGQ